jgi:hypothetical protein
VEQLRRVRFNPDVERRARARAEVSDAYGIESVAQELTRRIEAIHGG